MPEYLPELSGDGGKIFTGNFGPASPEQVEAIKSVLDRREREQAEREYLARKEQRERAKLREQEQAAKCRKILDAHRELVASATGLRKAILERHAPAGDECSQCVEVGYEENYLEDFPCGEYVMARDWEGDEPSDGVWRTSDFLEAENRHPRLRDEYPQSLGVRRYTWPDGRVRVFRQQPDCTWRETTIKNGDT